MKTAIEISELRDYIKSYRQNNETVAFVPTMGALHQGHLELIKEAKKQADRVAVSIFVNPTQFGAGEDFEVYPRTLVEDSQALQELGVDLVFAPTQSEIYPKGFQTAVSNLSVGLELCGSSRPGHFDGVCTIVTKLFLIVMPDVAVFGKKDYQQFKVIQTLVRDLHFPMQVIGVETVREEDGLAMSSRNRFLEGDQREVACILPHALNLVYDAYEQGERDPQKLKSTFVNALEPYPNVGIDYGEIRRQKDLSSYDSMVDEAPVFLAAVKVGKVRLIDNLELE